MDVSNVYSDLRIYRYSSASSVDGDNAYSFNYSYYDASSSRKEKEEPPQAIPNNKPADKLEISPEAKKAQKDKENNSNNEQSTSQNNSKQSSSQSNNKLSSEDQKQIEELKKRDAEVRAHEAAHLAAGGNLVRGGASYTYQTGPDGKQYAVGGEVKIDTSIEPDNPEATISKMQQVKSAALAPSDPSPQDRSVAQMAARYESKARVELQKQNSEKINKTIEDLSDKKSENENMSVKNQANPVAQTSNNKESNPINNDKKNNPNTVSNLIKTYQKSEKETNETIGKLINKINLAPVAERLQTKTLKIKEEYIKKVDSF